MQNIASNRWPARFILSVFLSWLVYQIWQNIPPYPTNDTLRQLQEGISENYYNWKPAIYSWLLGSFEQLSNGNGILCTLIFQLILLGGGVALISLYYAQKHPKYALLVLILPLFFTVKGMLVQVVGNDAAAAGCYLTYIGTLLWGSKIKHKTSRIVLLIAAFAILGLGMNLRHNAIPAVMLLAGWGSWRLGYKPFKSCGIAIGLCLAFLIIGNGITYKILQAEPSYPLKSPLADDLVNLSIVNGEWSDYCKQQGATELLPPHEQFQLSPQVANAGKPINPYIIPTDKTQRKKIYEDMRAAWWKEVSTHPEKYIAIKLFFFHQHLLEGRCLPPLCRLFRSYYPHVRIHMEAESQHPRAWFNREFIVLTLMPMSAFMIVMGALVCVRRHRWSNIQTETLDSLFFMAAALLYCATFILLVLAATEQRYYIIRASLSAVALALFFLSLWKRNAQKT